MLTIRTYLDKSSISGIGLFANQDIPRNQIIWEYSPLIDFTFSPSEWNNLKANLSVQSFEMIQRYSYKENDRYILCADNAQFMNHSQYFFNVKNTPDKMTMFAAKDIEIGEEILCNYLEYSDEDDHHLKELVKQSY